MDLPFFNFPTQDDYVRFFCDISDAIDIGIIIKNCFWFGAPSITAETMRRLADAEHVIAIKWDVPPGEDYDAMREFAHIVNVIDDSSNPVRCHKNGGRGHVDGWLLIHPPYALKTWELLEAHCYDEAQVLFDGFRKSLAPFTSKVSARSGGDRLSRGLLAAIGHPIGDPRPPTIPLDADEMAELRELLRGFGWPVPA